MQNRMGKIFSIIFLGMTYYWIDMKCETQKEREKKERQTEGKKEGIFLVRTVGTRSQ